MSDNGKRLDYNGLQTMLSAIASKVKTAVLSKNLISSQKVGGVVPGDSWTKDTPLETVMRDILDPVLYPELTAPSATLSATGAKLLETGSSIDTLMTVTFSRGTIDPSYGTSGYRSGEAIDYTLAGLTQYANVFNVTVTEAKTSYTATVRYGQGEQPLDSEGEDYDSPLPAGSVVTPELKYEFVDALYANTADITSISKLALISKSAKQKDLDYPPQTVANPETFDVPASWTVTAVQVKNDLSGAFEDALSQFTVTDVTHDDASGNSVNYKRYQFDLGYDTGSRIVRIKWS